MRITCTIAVSIAGFGVAACAGLFAPKEALRLGHINDPDRSVTVPDTVAASTDFVVSFHTDGGGCNRAGNTQVTMVDGRTAEIRPYDYAQVNPSACTTILALFLHSATIRFGTGGIATVRLVGQSGDSTITLTRAVVVK